MSNANLIVLIVLGVTIAFFVGLTLWLALSSQNVQKQRAWLKQHGKQIIAKVIRISGPKAKSRRGKTWQVIEGVMEVISAFGEQQHVEPASPDSPESRHVIAEWYHPETNQRYEFHADISLQQARRYQVGKPLPVLIDKQNLSHYWVAPPRSGSAPAHQEQISPSRAFTGQDGNSYTITLDGQEVEIKHVLSLGAYQEENTMFVRVTDLKRLAEIAATLEREPEEDEQDLEGPSRAFTGQDGSSYTITLDNQEVEIKNVLSQGANQEENTMLVPVTDLKQLAEIAATLEYEAKNTK